MGLKEILEFRRAVRHFSNTERIDTARVRQCLELAQLAPSSSNMHLYEFYHVTDKATLQYLAKACLGQSPASTAQEMVIFVTRQDLYRQRAKTLLTFEQDNIARNCPPEKQTKRLKQLQLYYGQIMPLTYSHFFGLIGLLRKIITLITSIFRPAPLYVSESDTRVVVHKSCALAAQTFILAMAEQGYDTCPLEGFDSRRVKRVLHLPHGAQINLIVACGIRNADGVQSDRFRLPFVEIYRNV